MTEEERAFLTLFSAFRTPVKPDTFARVFRAADFADEECENRGSPLQGVLARLDDGAFEGVVARLTGSGQVARTHEQLKEYYLGLVGDTQHNPTLEQLAPLIEVVFHACRAGVYDDARKIQRGCIDQVNCHVLIHQLGAYETQLAIMQQFFPDGDTSQEQQVSKASDKGWILNEVGVCLMGLGRLDTAVPFFERGTKLYLELEEWSNASVGYQNLAELNANLGRVAASAAAMRALELARQAANKGDERNSLMWQAWTAHLRGIQHAEYLLRMGDADYARRVTDANLEICERNRWADQISMCQRVLGQLDAAAGQDESARTHFDTALRIARGISFRPALIEALLGRGRWAAQYHGRGGFHARQGEGEHGGSPLRQAFSDLG